MGKLPKQPAGATLWQIDEFVSVGYTTAKTVNPGWRGRLTSGATASGRAVGMKLAFEYVSYQRQYCHWCLSFGGMLGTERCRCYIALNSRGLIKGK